MGTSGLGDDWSTSDQGQLEGLVRGLLWNAKQAPINSRKSYEFLQGLVEIHGPRILFTQQDVLQILDPRTQGALGLAREIIKQGLVTSRDQVQMLFVARDVRSLTILRLALESGNFQLNPADLIAILRVGPIAVPIEDYRRVLNAAVDNRLNDLTSNEVALWIELGTPQSLFVVRAASRALQHAEIPLEGFSCETHRGVIRRHEIHVYSADKSDGSTVCSVDVRTRGGRVIECYAGELSDSVVDQVKQGRFDSLAPVHLGPKNPVRDIVVPPEPGVARAAEAARLELNL